MIALRRIVWTASKLHPSFSYFTCQKLVNEFSSKASVAGRKIQTQVPNDRDIGRSKPEETTKDLVKKLKLLQQGSKGKNRHYIMDRHVAAMLVNYLKQDLGENDIIVEISPGLGLLTDTLLVETTNTVIAYEPNNSLRSNLEKTLLPRFSHRLQLQSQDLRKFYGYYIINQREPDKTLLHDFISPMQRRMGADYSPVKIVGVNYDLNFMKSLIFSYTYQCSLYENISPDFYLCIPYKVYKKIHYGTKNSFRDISLIFQYYFTLETLNVVPRESFYPVYSNAKAKTESEEAIYMIKISPRKDLFDKVR